GQGHVLVVLDQRPRRSRQVLLGARGGDRHPPPHLVVAAARGEQVGHVGGRERFQADDVVLEHDGGGEVRGHGGDVTGRDPYKRDPFGGFSRRPLSTAIPSGR